MLPRCPSVLLVILALCLTACLLRLPGISPASLAPGNSPSPSPLAFPSPSAESSPPASSRPAISPGTAPPASSSARPSPSTSPSSSASPSPDRAYPPTPLGSAIALVANGSRIHPVIAITIDDGFSSAAVLADLAILERERVNATWFPIGHVVASFPDTWRAVAKAGFPIANHTYDHANLTHYSYTQIVADIEQDSAVVSKIIGEPLVPFVRPMGGAWNQTVLKAAAAAGQRAVVLWDATTGDTAAAPGRTKVNLLVHNATLGRNGSIILMHANLPYTQQALPQIIAYYRARGFEFVTLGQMFGVPGPVPFPPASLP